MREALEILALIARIITPLIGFPAAIVAMNQYIKNRDEDRKRHEAETYEKLDASYIAFLKFCIENSDLDIFDIPDKTPLVRDEKIIKRELIAFSILMSMFERAYLMFVVKKVDEELKRNQWDSGWHLYINGYCRRKNFQEAWPSLGTQFDRQFLKYMHEENQLLDLRDEK